MKEKNLEEMEKNQSKRHTKIVCTIGPSVDTPQQIDALIEAGMNVARLNFSHGSHAEHGKRIAMLKAARQRASKDLAIMLDTKGPEVRLGQFDGVVSFEKGDFLILSTQGADSDIKDAKKYFSVFETADTNKHVIAAICPIEPQSIIEDISRGDCLLFDDGKFSSKVCQIHEGLVLVQLDNPGQLTSRKGVNIPDVSLSLEALTEKDREDIRFGIECQIDYIAASFVRSARHMQEIKEFIRQEGGDIPVLAKIENQEGVDNFDAILQVSDGIMIARGDLGVELPLSKVPNLQKVMIQKCCRAGKPSITATQMLESMIHAPRPTRAEVSDVANAIYDSTSAVMLSGETAMGKYPVEVVRLMSEVITESEKHAPYTSCLQDLHNHHNQDVSSCIALAAVKTAKHSDAKAIFCFSRTGRTARLISRLRPSTPILVYTPNKVTYHQLSLCWGITPTCGPEIAHLDAGFEKLAAVAQQLGIVEQGDTVLMTAGLPFAQNAASNLMLLECIGDVLFKAGDSYGSETICAPFIIDEGQEFSEFEGKAVLISRFSESCAKRFAKAKALILENTFTDITSAVLLKSFAKKQGVSVLWNAFGAETALKAALTLHSDSNKGGFVKIPWIRLDPHKRLILAS